MRREVNLKGGFATSKALETIQNLKEREIPISEEIPIISMI